METTNVNVSENIRLAFHMHALLARLTRIEGVTHSYNKRIRGVHRNVTGVYVHVIGVNMHIIGLNMRVIGVDIRAN